MRIVKYAHCTPISPSRGTRLWKDPATVRAIGVPKHRAKEVPTATRGGGRGETLTSLSPNSVELASERLKQRYLKRGLQGIMPGSTQVR